LADGLPGRWLIGTHADWPGMSDRPVLPPRKTAFILTSTDHGTMIVNRFDYKMEDGGAGFGVGFKILNETSYESGEILIGAIVLESRRRHSATASWLSIAARTSERIPSSGPR
jgi:hypothetical protein